MKHENILTELCVLCMGILGLKIYQYKSGWYKCKSLVFSFLGAKELSETRMVVSVL
jgi:hypothetical protein